MHGTLSLADTTGSLPMLRPIRVVLAEQHPRTRLSLRMLLESEEGLQVVAETGDLASTRYQVFEQHPDVLVVDLHLREGSSLDVIRQLRQHAPSTQIVVLTMQENPGFAREAAAAGALGFVFTDRADDELAEAVRRAAAGQPFTSPRLATSRSAPARSLRRL